MNEFEVTVKVKVNAITSSQALEVIESRLVTDDDRRHNVKVIESNVRLARVK